MFPVLKHYSAERSFEELCLVGTSLKYRRYVLTATCVHTPETEHSCSDGRETQHMRTLNMLRAGANLPPVAKLPPKLAGQPAALFTNPGRRHSLPGSVELNSIGISPAHCVCRNVSEFSMASSYFMSPHSVGPAAGPVLGRELFRFRPVAGKAISAAIRSRTCCMHAPSKM